LKEEDGERRGNEDLSERKLAVAVNTWSIGAVPFCFGVNFSRISTGLERPYALVSKIP
jgi:hypothetical protein